MESARPSARGSSHRARGRHGVVRPPCVCRSCRLPRVHPVALPRAPHAHGRARARIVTGPRLRPCWRSFSGSWVRRPASWGTRCSPTSAPVADCGCGDHLRPADAGRPESCYRTARAAEIKPNAQANHAGAFLMGLLARVGPVHQAVPRRLAGSGAAGDRGRRRGATHHLRARLGVPFLLAGLAVNRSLGHAQRTTAMLAIERVRRSLRHAALYPATHRHALFDQSLCPALPNARPCADAAQRPASAERRAHGRLCWLGHAAQ